MIDAEKATTRMTIGRMTELLGMSRSGFYAWSARQDAPLGPRQAQREDLLVKIKVAHDASDGVNGAPRITADLRETGEVVSVKTVAKLMRANEIRGISPRPWRPVTTIADTTVHTIPDLVESAQRRAVTFREGRTAGVIFHADGGCQYTSAQLAQVAEDLDVRLSVGRTGVCWDNSQQESFWSTLKTEHYNRYTFATRAEAIASVTTWIEQIYNRRRRHSSLGQTNPVAYEHQLTTAAQAANRCPRNRVNPTDERSRLEGYTRSPWITTLRGFSTWFLLLPLERRGRSPWWAKYGRQMRSLPPKGVPKHRESK